MGDVLNLRRARKARDRALEARQADLNRVAHGRSKVERTESAMVKALDAKRLDAHRRDGGFGEDPERS